MAIRFEQFEYAPGAPQTPTEVALAEIWCEVLQLPQVGRIDNFFACGGHSLLAMQVATRVRATLGIAVDVRTFFEAPTLAALGQVIEQYRQAGRVSKDEPLVATARPATLPLSYAQQRSWFLDQWTGPNATDNIPQALRLRGPLVVTALQAALAAIIQRHEVLRTSFPTIDGVAHQAIAPSLALPLPVVNLADAPDAATTLTELLNAAAWQPFSLSSGPLLRATLYRLQEAEHVLLLTLHHIIADDWSLGVLLRELEALYQAYRTGGSSPLAPLPVQYADFTLWQRTWLQGEEMARQRHYWQHRLVAAPTLLTLPTDFSRPAVQPFQGELIEETLSAAMTATLQQLSQQQGVSLFMTLYAAFAVFLARYSGQEDLVIGTTVANRQPSESELLIGFFVNTLPLRVDLAGNPRFVDLLAQVRELTLDAYTHQDLPFEQIVSDLRIERSLSYAPLCQVLLTFNNTPQVPPRLAEMTVTPVELASRVARFDLILHLTQAHECLQMGWEYNRALFTRATVARMLGHFQVLLAALVADPTVTIQHAPLLTASERQQLLVEWGAPSVRLPTDDGAAELAEVPQAPCVHQLFEDQVERTPDATALIWASGECGMRQAASGADAHQWTYSELNARANQLAHYLQRQGVGPDVLVGICLERTPEMIIALLAILKASGGYLPFDPTYPAERLAYMVENAQIRFLITTEPLRPQLTWAKAVPCFTEWALLDDQPAQNLANRATAENVIYCLYTSGSTGNPKGIVMPQRAISNLIRWQLAYTTAPSQARTLQFSPLTFDVACQEIFATLCAGGALVLVDDETRRDPRALLRYIATLAVERLYLPFVALQQLAEMATGPMPATLREVNTAGEQLQITPAIAQWFRGTACSLQNHYGPTETHVVTAWKLPPAVDEWPALPPIGHPIANTQVYVLDQARQPAPIGVAGELYIGGVALAHGYCQRAELTAERFVANPFGADRLYKTGDQGRYRPDGVIEFLGRSDFQLKIRGFRVEPGEIEVALRHHPAVVDSVVVARPNARGEKQLVAYLMVRTTESLTSELLRTHLLQTLPPFMIPARFVLLDSFPLTTSGKINRLALPSPHFSQVLPVTSSVAPRNATEEQIAAIWRELLTPQHIGVHDNFFALGGHSLLAMQVIWRIQAEFQVEFPLAKFFAGPTIAEMAVTVLQAQAQQQTDTFHLGQLLAELEAMPNEQAITFLQRN